MTSKKTLMLMTAGFMLTTSSAVLAEKKYDTGATDTEIKIGNTAPYTGFLSSVSKLGKSMTAYFKMVNDNGGINGRKVNFISYDDAFDPAKTVGQTRKLVEDDGVLLTSGSVGTVPALSVRPYLNEKKIPTLFMASSSPLMKDPEHFPYSFGALIDQSFEMQTYVDYIVANLPDAKIAILSSHDEYGLAYSKTLKERLAFHKKESMLVAEETYDNTNVNISAQMLKLKDSGATVFLNMAIGKFAIQALQASQDSSWKPLRFLNTNISSRESTLTPAGLPESKGIITVQAWKDPSDPKWDNEPDMKAYKAFMAKYLPDEKVTDLYAVYGYSYAANTEAILKACGDELTHANVLKVTSNWKAQGTMFLPTVEANYTPTNYLFFKKLDLVQFNGNLWEKMPDTKAAKS
jgi:branched-chain amino acid transport system substrate-binding protein